VEASTPRSGRWQKFLAQPAFVINLKSRPERLRSAVAQLGEAGFTNVERFEAVDASKAPMADIFRQHGIFAFDESNPGYPLLSKYPGTQGCILSHLAVLKQIIDRNIAEAHIFEDDITFHSGWLRLAPHYFAKTPRDWDIIYLGSQIEFGKLHRWPPRTQRALYKLGLPATALPITHFWGYNFTATLLYPCVHDQTNSRKGLV
jgi:hypothetical protein